MKYHKMWLLFLLLLGALLVACGGSDEAPSDGAVQSDEAALVDGGDTTEVEAPKPTATPLPVPTDTPAPTPTAESEVIEDEFVDLSTLNADLNEFASAEIEMVFTLLADGLDDQSMIISVLYSQDPPGQLTEMHIEGFNAADLAEMEAQSGTVGFTVATIGEKGYMSVPGEGCFSFPNTEDASVDPLESMLAPSDIISGLNNARQIRPNETINGVETIHYQFDQSSFSGTDELGLGIASGDIYVAVDGNYVVRMVTRGTDSEMTMFDDLTAADSFIFEYNVSAVNQPVDIVIPDGCDEDSIGSDYPIADDATDTISLGGLVSYSSAQSAEDLGAFYREAMSDAGWTYNEDESLTMDAFQSLIFSRDEETVNITIIAGGDATQVLISAEE